MIRRLIAQAIDYGWPGDGTAANPYLIANLTFDGSSGVGLMIQNIDLYVIIDNCTITNSDYCIDIVGSNNMTIKNNTFYGNSYGFNIYMDESNNNTIVNNSMIGNNYGIYLSDSKQQHGQSTASSPIPHL